MARGDELNDFSIELIWLRFRHGCLLNCVAESVYSLHQSAAAVNRLTILVVVNSVGKTEEASDGVQ